MPAGAVIGRVVVAVPALGYVIAVLSTPGGLAAVLGLAGVLIALTLLLPGGVRPASGRRQPPSSGPIAEHA